MSTNTIDWIWVVYVNKNTICITRGVGTADGSTDASAVGWVHEIDNETGKYDNEKNHNTSFICRLIRLIEYEWYT